MPSLSLARRKSQLELLAQACALRQPVRVVARTQATTRFETSTRFLALHPDGVVLEWPAQAGDQVPVSGAPVDVRFAHRDRPFGFRSETRGRMWWSSGAERQTAAWKLALPLCVESRPPRQHYRVPLAGLPPVIADCVSVAHPPARFTAQVRNLSVGGMRATAALAAGVQVTVGDLFWVQFALPGDEVRCEFVVCVTHVRAVGRQNLVVLGALFCPSEDQSEHYEKLRRIEQFVAQRAGDGTCRPGAGPVGGA